MSAVKITYLITGLGTGGAEMMLYRLLAKLDRNHFSPEVVALLDLKGPLTDRIKALGVPVTVLDMRSKFDLTVIQKLAKHLAEQQPQILHTQLFAADIMGRMLGRVYGVPVIVTSIRNIYYGSRWRDLLIKWTDRFAKRTTFVSALAAQRFIDQGLVPKEKAVVIHNGLDPLEYRADLSAAEKKRWRKKLGVPEKAYFILAVGSLTRQKGYSLLFEALKILCTCNPSFYLIVAGEGPLLEILQDLAARLDLTEKIGFIGRCDQVPELMAAADVLVLSSLWEGLPGVVLEAMASSLPVVATAVGGVPELIIDGITGLLVKPENPGDLAGKLKMMMAMSSAERSALGQAGYKKIEQEFSLVKMKEAYESLYQSCLRSLADERADTLNG